MVTRDDGSAAGGQPMMLAGHSVEFDSVGRLMPWTSWNTALDREMNFYQLCPVDHGYPRFAFTTFMDGGWEPFPDRTDTIPANQNGWVFSRISNSLNCAQAGSPLPADGVSHGRLFGE